MSQDVRPGTGPQRQHPAPPDTHGTAHTNTVNRGSRGGRGRSSGRGGASRPPPSHDDDPARSATAPPRMSEPRVRIATAARPPNTKPASTEEFSTAADPSFQKDAGAAAAYRLPANINSMLMRLQSNLPSTKPLKEALALVSQFERDPLPELTFKSCERLLNESRKAAALWDDQVQVLLAKACAYAVSQTSGCESTITRWFHTMVQHQYAPATFPFSVVRAVAAVRGPDKLLLALISALVRVIETDDDAAAEAVECAAELVAVPSLSLYAANVGALVKRLATAALMVDSPRSACARDALSRMTPLWRVNPQPLMETFYALQDELELACSQGGFSAGDIGARLLLIGTLADALKADFLNLPNVDAELSRLLSISRVMLPVTPIEVCSALTLVVAQLDATRRGHWQPLVFDLLMGQLRALLQQPDEPEASIVDTLLLFERMVKNSAMDDRTSAHIFHPLGAIMSTRASASEAVRAAVRQVIVSAATCSPAVHVTIVSFLGNDMNDCVSMMPQVQDDADWADVEAAAAELITEIPTQSASGIRVEQKYTLERAKQLLAFDIDTLLSLIEASGNVPAHRNSLLRTVLLCFTSGFSRARPSFSAHRFMFGRLSSAVAGLLVGTDSALSLLEETVSACLIRLILQKRQLGLDVHLLALVWFGDVVRLVPRPLGARSLDCLRLVCGAGESEPELELAVVGVLGECLRRQQCGPLQSEVVTALLRRTDSASKDVCDISAASLRSASTSTILAVSSASRDAIATMRWSLSNDVLSGVQYDAFTPLNTAEESRATRYPALYDLTVSSSSRGVRSPTPSQLRFYVWWESARALVHLRLHTPQTPSKEQPVAFAQALSIVTTAVMSEPRSVESAVDLLAFVDALEKYVFSAVDGSDSIPAVDSHSASFVKHNRKVFKQLFERIRPAVLQIALTVGDWPTTVQHGFARIIELLASRFAAEAPKSPGDLASDAERGAIAVARASVEMGRPAYVTALQSMLESADLPASFEWLPAVQLHAAGHFESALNAYRVWMSGQAGLAASSELAHFVDRMVLDCFASLADWAGLEAWLAGSSGRGLSSHLDTQHVAALRAASLSQWDDVPIASSHSSTANLSILADEQPFLKFMGCASGDSDTRLASKLRLQLDNTALRRVLLQAKSPGLWDVASDADVGTSPRLIRVLSALALSAGRSSNAEDAAAARLTMARILRLSGNHDASLRWISGVPCDVFPSVYETIKAELLSGEESRQSAALSRLASLTQAGLDQASTTRALLLWVRRQPSGSDALDALHRGVAESAAGSPEALKAHRYLAARLEASARDSFAARFQDGSADAARVALAFDDEAYEGSGEPILQQLCVLFQWISAGGDPSVASLDDITQGMGHMSLSASPLPSDDVLSRFATAYQGAAGLLASAVEHYGLSMGSGGRTIHSIKSALAALQLLCRHPWAVHTAFDRFVVKTATPDVWAELVPQLVARLAHRSSAVVDCVEALLICVASGSPSSVLRLVSVAPPRSQMARDAWARILAALPAEKRSQALLFTAELRRIALLWDDVWNTALGRFGGEFNRVVQRVAAGGSRSAAIRPVLAALDQLMDETVRAAPSTPYEAAFIAKYAGQLEAAIAAVRDSPSDASPRQQWAPLKELHTEFLKKPQDASRSRLALQDVAPALIHSSFDAIEVPIDAANGVTIRGLDSHITVFDSKTHPKRMRMRGSDGRDFWFLMKGGEDVRTDERVMQLLKVLNADLGRDKSARLSKLSAVTYRVVPFEAQFGLIQWVDGAIPIYRVYQKAYARQAAHAAAASAGGKRGGLRPNQMFAERLMARLQENTGKKTDMRHVEAKLRSSERRDIPLSVFRSTLADLCAASPESVLSNELWCHAPTVQHWLDARDAYARTTAIMSTVGATLGLGDRHLNNILVDLQSGRVTHIDYAVCFDRGIRLRVPETVPFRLTRVLRHALGPAGETGVFSDAAVATMEVVQRQSAGAWRNILSAFIYDPLLEWRAEEADHRAQQQNAADASVAKAVEQLSAEGPRVAEAYALLLAYSDAQLSRMQTMGRLVPELAGLRSALAAARDRLSDALPHLAAFEQQARVVAATLIAECQPVVTKQLTALQNAPRLLAALDQAPEAVRASPLLVQARALLARYDGLLAHVSPERVKNNCMHWRWLWVLERLQAALMGGEAPATCDAFSDFDGAVALALAEARALKEGYSKATLRAKHLKEDGLAELHRLVSTRAERLGTSSSIGEAMRGRRSTFVPAEGPKRLARQAALAASALVSLHDALGWIAETQLNAADEATALSEAARTSLSAGVKREEEVVEAVRRHALPQGIENIIADRFILLPADTLPMAMALATLVTSEVPLGLSAESQAFVAAMVTSTADASANDVASAFVAALRFAGAAGGLLDSELAILVLGVPPSVMQAADAAAKSGAPDAQRSVVSAAAAVAGPSSVVDAVLRACGPLNSHLALLHATAQARQANDDAIATLCCAALAGDNEKFRELATHILEVFLHNVVLPALTAALHRRAVESAVAFCGATEVAGQVANDRFAAIAAVFRALAQERFVRRDLVVSRSMDLEAAAALVAEVFVEGALVFAAEASDRSAEIFNRRLESLYWQYERHIQFPGAPEPVDVTGCSRRQLVGALRMARQQASAAGPTELSQWQHAVIETLDAITDYEVNRAPDAAAAADGLHARFTVAISLISRALLLRSRSPPTSAAGSALTPDAAALLTDIAAQFEQVEPAVERLRASIEDLNRVADAERCEAAAVLQSLTGALESLASSASAVAAQIRGSDDRASVNRAAARAEQDLGAALAAAQDALATPNAANMRACAEALARVWGVASAAKSSALAGLVGVRKDDERQADSADARRPEQAPQEMDEEDEEVEEEEEENAVAGDAAVSVNRLFVDTSGCALDAPNAFARRALFQVHRRLQGRWGQGDEDERMSAEGQVASLVKQAVDKDRLAVMFEGWMPWV